MSYPDYLALEREAPTKHEYLRGMVLAGARPSTLGSLARSHD